MLLCIDPGMRKCGVALFRPDGELVRAVGLESAVPTSIIGVQAWRGIYVVAQKWVSSQPEVGTVDCVLVENQAINWNRTENPNSVMQCAGAAGALSTVLPGITLKGILPETWKGTIPKDDMTERIHSRIKEFGWLDRLAPVPKKVWGDMLDAVGMGLWQYGKLTARRVIHR